MCCRAMARCPQVSAVEIFRESASTNRSGLACSSSNLPSLVNARMRFLRQTRLQYLPNVRLEIHLIFPFRKSVQAKRPFFR